jgi:glycosyltransferase involved in cell wall biosynthesis
MKQPLTVIVPCKDERMNIRSCIESFHGIADEVLIADSGSQDETIEIALEFNKVRVIRREYITSGNFKNWAIPQAKHEWILIVDADERVTPQLANEITLELSRGPSEDGFWIYRDNHFMGKRQRFGDARSDKVLRLFHRDRGRYEGPSDHGEVRISTGRVGVLKNKLQHFSVWNYDQLFEKMHRYTTLQAQQWSENGRDTSYFKLLVRPMFRFFRELILQGGILDGKVGIQTAWIAAFYSFNKQARLWTLNHGEPQPDVEGERNRTQVDDLDRYHDRAA